MGGLELAGGRTCLLEPAVKPRSPIVIRVVASRPPGVASRGRFRDRRFIILRPTDAVRLPKTFVEVAVPRILAAPGRREFAVEPGAPPRSPGPGDLFGILIARPGAEVVEAIGVGARGPAIAAQACEPRCSSRFPFGGRRGLRIARRRPVLRSQLAQRSLDKRRQRDAAGAGVALGRRDHLGVHADREPLLHRHAAPRGPVLSIRASGCDTACEHLDPSRSAPARANIEVWTI